MKTTKIKQLKLEVAKSDISAITRLAEIYMYEIPLKKNCAVKLFQKGADLKDPYLTWCLADAFYYGEGVMKSIQDAVKYYKIAASLGQAEAMTDLGAYYIEGILKVPNYKKAINYYKQAANLNEPNAIHNLGICYSNGNGVNKNMTKAFELFKKAATFGHEEAQYKVAWCFIYGEGVNKNIKEAKIWLLKAVNTGHYEADNLLKKIG